MRALVLRFLNDRSAATTMECGLLAAGIVSVVIIAIAFGFGADRNDTYVTASTALQ